MSNLEIQAHKAGVGNVYHVIQTNHGQVDELTDYHERTYRDGSSVVQSSISNALTAAVAERNDYVIVRPDNDFYSEAATLTMDENDVHLIAPSSIGTGMGSFRAVVQGTDTDAVITITGNGVEVAGLFFTPLSGYDIMTFGSGTVWSAYIHDNYFGMYAEESDSSYGIYSNGAVSNYCIRDNTFSNFSAIPTGNANTLNAFIGLTSTSSTRGLIKGNYLHTGANTTVAKGIHANTLYAMIVGNYLGANAAYGAAKAGAFTVGIEALACATVIDNRIAMTDTSKAIVVGDVTSPITCINNMSSASGGTIAM